jgi:alpha-ketoglutarate-dependent dioxygenase alkB family protein 2
MFQGNNISLKDNDGKLNVTYQDNFISEGDEILQLLNNDIIYNSAEESKIKIFGKEIEIPRRQVAYGETGTSYKFSGTTVVAKNWNDDNELCKFILKVKNKISQEFDFDPNFVLINRYDNGDQYIGFHSDDEKDLVSDSPIVGVTFGHSRELIFKNNKTNKKKSIVTKHGSIYSINYPTNKYYKHSIPKTKHVNTFRISFTFRKMKL